MRPYPAYKDSGVEWLGEVPEGWEVKRLRRVVALNPSKAESNWLDAEAEVSFIPMEAVGENGEIDLSRTRPVGEVENGYTYFRNGDMTFAKITPCFENGKRALMRDLKGGIGFGTTELTVLRAEPSQTTPEFLFWLLSTPEFRKTGEAHMYGAGGQKRVPDDFVREFAAPLPEQQSIARFLDKEVAKIDALVAEQRRLIALLAEKRQAVISHAVTKGLNPATPLKPSGIDWLGDIPEGWEVVPLGRLVSLNPSKSEVAHRSREEEVSFLPMEAVGQDGSLDLSRTRPIGEVETGYTYLREGDVAFAKITPCFENGKGALMRGLAGGIAFGTTELTVLRPSDERLSHTFLACVVSSPIFLRLGEGHMYGAGGQKRVPDDFAREFRIALPSRSEQDAIVEHIKATHERFDDLTAAATSAISLLQERRAALISAAVTGKIDLRPHFAQSLSEPETA
jgi:type I restriction enzyme S subunit